MVDLQESLQCYCNVLSVFGFKSAKYDLKLIKSYLLPILVNEQGLEPTVIKKVNQFISSKIDDFQLFDIMNFLGGSTSLDSFLKAYKISELKELLPYEWFGHPDKNQNTELPHMTSFTVNFVAVTLFKPNRRTMLIYWKVDWPQNKPLSNWNCQSHPLLELRTINTFNNYGSRNKWAHSKSFCASITIKMLCQAQKQCKKWLTFTMAKKSIC